MQKYNEIYIVLVVVVKIYVEIKSLNSYKIRKLNLRPLHSTVPWNKVKIWDTHSEKLAKLKIVWPGPCGCAGPRLLVISSCVRSWRWSLANSMLLKVQSCDVLQVQPVLVKKQPKFPTRERHMAIRRKKSTATVTPETIKTISPDGVEQRWALVYGGDEVV